MKALAHLNKYFWKYKWRLLLGFAFVICQNFFAIYPAQLVRQALDTVAGFLEQNSQNQPYSNELFAAVSEKIFYFFLLIILLALARGVLMFFMRQTLIVMSRFIEYDLKNEIYDQYQKLSQSFYRVQNTGDLVNRISEDVSRVRMYLGPALMYTLNLVVLFSIVIVIMYRVNSTLAMYVLMPLPLLSIGIYIVSHKMNKRSEEVQEQQSRLSTFVQETFSGIRIIKSYVREKQMQQEFDDESKLYKLKYLQLVKINSVFFPLMLLLVGCSTLLVIFIGGREVMAGRFTAGNIAEFIIYVNMLTWPVASLGWVTSLVQRAAASQQRINAFLQLKPEIADHLTGIKTVHGAIEFKNVSFTYPETGIEALKNLSFTVDENKSLAIIGHTGSGKSTIANLLVRMIEPTQGDIFIDGSPISQFSLKSLRNQIGYVPQDVFLFSDTISNNIAFGNIHPVDDVSISEKIKSAASEAVIAESIEQFPMGYETVVGERGITLSGGQKQRISIARALIRSPRILLLDDCLSAVDTHTEEQILQNIRSHFSKRTVIIISHRISSAKYADKIIVLEHGSIAEEGTHESLLERKGIYYKLYEKQSPDNSE